MGVVSPFAVDCARVATGMGLPTAMTWHCMLGPLEPVFRAAGHVRGWASRGVAMSAVSAVAAEPLQRIVGSAGMVNVLPNGIDVDRWATPPDEAPAREAGGVRVVSAMRLAARKRPLPLLRTMARVRALVPAETAISLEIFGDGPDRGRLERFIDAHDMGGWVRLPGRVTREELRAEVCRGRHLRGPCALESFGIAALEARTVGLPVVGRLGSGLQEFVTDGLNGYLAADDEAMAGCLARLVTDDGLRGSMTAYNRSTPPEQSWGRILDGAEAEYRRAIALAGSAGDRRPLTSDQVPARRPGPSIVVGVDAPGRRGRPSGARSRRRSDRAARRAWLGGAAGARRHERHGREACADNDFRG